MKSFKEFINESQKLKSLVGEEGDVIEHDDGIIDIHTNPQYAPRKQSVIRFEVPEEKRGKGIGDILVKKQKKNIMIWARKYLH